MITERILMLLCIICTSLSAIALMDFISEGKHEMMNRFNQLEDSIREQLDLSKRTFDASSRMIGEALRLANQKQGYADAYEKYWDEDENEN